MRRQFHQHRITSVWWSAVEDLQYITGLISDRTSSRTALADMIATNERHLTAVCVSHFHSLSLHWLEPRIQSEGMTDGLQNDRRLRSTGQD